MCIYEGEISSFRASEFGAGTCFITEDTEIPTTIDSSTTINLPSATGSIIVGMSVLTLPDICRLTFKTARDFALTKERVTYCSTYFILMHDQYIRYIDT
jgi:hypothetical protein